MKLKKWLPEYKQITYAEYKELPDIDRWEMDEHFDYSLLYSRYVPHYERTPKNGWFDIKYVHEMKNRIQV